MILLNLQKLHKQTNHLKSETKISNSCFSMTIINMLNETMQFFFLKKKKKVKRAIKQNQNK